MPPLVSALSDLSPLGRGHAAWALGRIGSPEARAALSARLATEPDEFGLEELRLALEA